MRCKVLGCKNEFRFQFPKNQKIRKKWLDFLNLPEDIILHPRSGLCKKHFLDTDFTRTEKDSKFIICISLYIFFY